MSSRAFLEVMLPTIWVAVEIELPFLGLMLRMEVFRLVLPKVHSDHNAEENRDDRHVWEYTVVRTASSDERSSRVVQRP